MRKTTTNPQNIFFSLFLGWELLTGLWDEADSTIILSTADCLKGALLVFDYLAGALLVFWFSISASIVFFIALYLGGSGGASIFFKFVSVGWGVVIDSGINFLAQNFISVMYESLGISMYFP